MGKLIFGTIYVFLVFFTSKGQSLYCYRCSSTLNSDCSDPASSWMITPTRCDLLPTVGLKPACVTREGRDFLDRITVNRDCALVPAGYAQSTCPGPAFSVFQTNLYCRLCYENACNADTVPDF